MGVSAANTHDSRCLESLVQAIPAIRSRRGPRRRRPDKLHADKGYDYPHLRRMLRARGIRPRIARRGIESPTGSADTDGSSKGPSHGSPATAG
ncbi:hypothetical protein GCM10029963_44910 [Micromonospora andamanensis]